MVAMRKTNWPTCITSISGPRLFTELIMRNAEAIERWRLGGNQYLQRFNSMGRKFHVSISDTNRTRTQRATLWLSVAEMHFSNRKCLWHVAVQEIYMGKNPAKG